MKSQTLYAIVVFIVLSAIVNAQNITNTTNSTDGISINVSINQTNTNITEIINNTEIPIVINESMIKIIKIPENISFGDIINLSLQIYKGSTRKYAVKVYFQDISNVSKTKIYGKYLNLTHNFSLQLVNNFDCNYESNNYTLFFEGLGVFLNKTVFVNSNCTKEVEEMQIEEEEDEQEEEEEPIEEEMVNRKVIFYITDFPEKPSVNESFNVKIKFLGDEQDNDVELFSYVYRYSKSYSGEREANKRKFVLKEDEEKTVTLENIIFEYGEELKLKVKIKFNDRKTYDEITREVKVEKKEAEPTPIAEEKPKEESEDEQIEKVVEVLAEQKIFTGMDSPDTVNLDKNTIYKSKSLRSLDIALYAIIGILVIILAYMLFKKDF